MPSLQLPARLPVLERPPVALRAFRDADTALVRSAGADPQIAQLTSIPADPSADEARAWIRVQDRLAEDGGLSSFAVVDAATRRAVGQVCLHAGHDDSAAVDFWIAPEHRRQGWATAALTVLTDWALWSLRARRLELFVEPRNEAGWRTAEAVGFRSEGLLRSWREIGGVRRDMAVYSRLPRDQRRRASRH